MLLLLLLFPLMNRDINLTEIVSIDIGTSANNIVSPENL